jgi:hypothetical protein
VAAFCLLVTIMRQPSTVAQTDSTTSSPASNPVAALTAADPNLGVAARDQHSAVLRRILPLTNELGQVRYRTNDFVLLENNLHYFEDGQWKQSEDTIESFPGGAVARRGPDQAIFSHDLNAEAVFDIQSADGTRLRGGLRAVQLTDLASGRSVTLGTVKGKAPGQLLPPNRIVFRDCLDGLQADLLLEWRRNRFLHDVILRERPPLPREMDPATTRFEVLTEFIEAPAPVLNEQFLEAEDGIELADHVTLAFGSMLMLRGRAVTVDEASALNLSGAALSEEGVPVLKQWHRLENGRSFLVESVGWREIEPALAELPLARAGEPSPLSRRVTLARVWPDRASGAAEPQPLQLASAPYRPEGLVIDFTLSGSVSTFTFTNGVTYYIPTSFTVGPSQAYFQPGCVIKYGNNASLTLSGWPSFPDTAQTPVFTSATDEAFGVDIDAAGTTPAQQPNPAIGMYYHNYNTEIKNARFRWCKTGVQYANASGLSVTYTLRDSLFEETATGVYLTTQSGTVALVNVEKCNVTTPVTGTGSWTGVMTTPDFCAGKGFAGMERSLAEENTSIIVPDTMGAIGPSEFFQVLNGKVAVFSRSTGARTDEQFLNAFFGGSEMFDPRVWYDHASQRWLACAVDRTPGTTSSDDVILKVSLSSSASLAANNWVRHAKSVVLSSGQSLDFATLGLDVNGYYLSVQIKDDSGNLGYRIQAFNKSGVFNSGYTLPPLLSATPSELNTWAIQPAYNWESAPVGGYVWFVAKGAPSGGDNRKISYRRAQWSGSNLVWVDTTWVTLSSTSYIDYYDISQGSSLAAPQSGGSVSLGATGSRLMMAVIRSGYLWTCHHVGLDGTDGDYDGGTVDRSAAQWLRLQVSSSSLSYSTHGRIYDNAVSSPYWYYFPSLSVDSSGNIVIGFSGAKSGEHVGAFFFGRNSGGTTTARPILVQAGRSAFNGVGSGRFGDYSATTIDPNDGSFWTTQEFSTSDLDPDLGGPTWGTWIMQIRRQ